MTPLRIPSTCRISVQDAVLKLAVYFLFVVETCVSGEFIEQMKGVIILFLLINFILQGNRDLLLFLFLLIVFAEASGTIFLIYLKLDQIFVFSLF